MHIADEPPLFAVDISLCFGYGPSAGTYGVVQDAGLDILRAAGIGPVITWVDNHLSIWLPQGSIANYNEACRSTAHLITEQGRRIKDGGHWWFKGAVLADETHEQFAEDCSHPIRDQHSRLLSITSAAHAYNFAHIDGITNQLGIPWELSKDTPFSSAPTFIGFVWDLENKTVGC